MPYPPTSKAPSFFPFNGIISTKPQNLAGAVQGRIQISQVKHATLSI